MAIILLTLLTVAFICFMLYTNKFYNPYKLYLFMGKKGVGKSTVLQKLAYQDYKRGWNIYCNIGDTTFQKAHQIDCSRLWEQEIKPHSVVLIDEVNLLWDNRMFKSFPQELNEWFRMQRHYKVKVYMFSQTSDVDKKIRDLTDRIYLVKRYFQVWIWCFPYEKEIAPPDPKRLNNPNEFVDTFQKKSIGPIGCILCWLPKWVKVHDSFKENLKTAEEKQKFLDDAKKLKRQLAQKSPGKKARKSKSNALMRPDPRRSSHQNTLR